MRVLYALLILLALNTVFLSDIQANRSQWSERCRDCSAECERAHGVNTLIGTRRVQSISPNPRETILNGNSQPFCQCSYRLSGNRDHTVAVQCLNTFIPR